MLFRNVGAKERGVVQKGSFCGCCEVAVQQFLYHKKRVAHYCAVLNHATVTGSQKNPIFVYNAFALNSAICSIHFKRWYKQNDKLKTYEKEELNFSMALRAE